MLPAKGLSDMDQYKGNRPVATMDCAYHKIEFNGIATGVYEVIVELGKTDRWAECGLFCGILLRFQTETVPYKEIACNHYRSPLYHRFSTNQGVHG